MESSCRGFQVYFKDNQLYLSKNYTSLCPDRNDVFISPTMGIVVCHDSSLVSAGQLSLKLSFVLEKVFEFLVLMVCKIGRFAFLSLYGQV